MKKQIVLLALFLLNCTTEKVEEVPALVSVGNGILTEKKLNESIPPSVKSLISQEQINNYIQQWIENELIYQDALINELDKEKVFKKELEKQKRDILIKNYLDNFYSKKYEISDSEAQQYYEDNKDSYELADDEVKALHILANTKKEADDARKRIRAGEDFEEVAKEISIDYLEKRRIDLGYFTREKIIPEIRSIFYNRNKVGSIPRPIKSEFGYHLVKIIDKRSKGSVKPFDEVKDQIVNRLKSMKRNEEYRDLIVELRNKININRNVDLLRKFYSDSTLITNKKNNEM